MLLRVLVLAVLLANHPAAIDAWAQDLVGAVSEPLVGHAVMVGQSEAVHRLPVEAPGAAEGPTVEVNPRRLVGSPVPLPFGRLRSPDALAQARATLSAAERTPAAGLNFEGIAATGAVPPDPIGDVGPNHYVQMVNTRFAIFNKSGALLSGPTNINQLFAGLPAGNQCVLNNDGDPVVLYDPLANRWLLSQFAVPGGPAGFHVCVAISQTPDPTGSYFLYDFAVPVFPDYFKIGVWPDGYYMAANEDAPGTVGVFALDRARMLQGLSASFIRFVVTNKNFLLPSDLDGVRPPPAGAPNTFYTFTDPSFWTGGGVDRLDLFAFHADFATPGNSTFTALPSLPITAFNYTVCGYFVLNCISQPSPGQTLDAVSEWPMWRFAYRNMETHESLVGNFTVDVTGANQAGIRWFELRKSGAGPWTLFQEGTHAPDGNHRWMGSIAMDASGNIALGYSVSGNSVFPSLRYATRLAGAALGTLEGEAVLIAGGGVQKNGFNRWGDYSAMSVDPSDDCTFWYTGEYYATTSEASWRTRIGTFKIPSCTSTVTVTVTVSATDANAAEAGLDPGVFTVSRTGPTGSPLTVFYTLGGSATNGTDYQNLPGSVTLPAGQASATITVTPIDDTLVEGPETVVIQLQANAAYTLGTPNSATVTLADDDSAPLTPTVTVSATDANAAEAGLDPGVFTVSRTGLTGSPLTVFYTLGGSATNGTDYQNLPGSVTLPAGQASATITVTPIDDTLVEGPETVVIQLQANAAYTLGTPNSATVTLADDDTAPLTPTVIFSDNMEGGPGGWFPQSPWALTTEAAHSGTHSWTDSPGGNYGDNATPSLVSPVLDLSGRTSVTLTFWHRYDLEQGFDFAKIWVTTNGGATWAGPLAQFTGTSLAWTSASVDLSAFAGQPTVQIAFQLVSDPSITRDGWYIDDVVVGSASFGDVPPSHIFWPWIEALFKAGITGGCSANPPQYCPDVEVTRGSMAVFLLRSIHGASYQPPAATGMFTDVPVTHPFATWIEQLAQEGITAGCSTSPPQYCPDADVTRGQMAVFLLRAKHGAAYQPPAATGMFMDVPVTHPFATWIEQLAREGITGGCSTSPPQYCPDATVTRGQMAVFLVRAFNLPM